MNIQRIGAIFEKDVKEFMKNPMLFFMPVSPILLALFYSRMNHGGETEVLSIYLIIGITFAAVTTGCMMMLMAEEHEKKTLRGLVLSPASFLDIIVGKSLFTTLITFVTLVICLIMFGANPVMNLQAIIGLIILFFFFLFLGVGVGLFVQSVGMTTAYLMPILFLFGFTPMVWMLNLNEESIVLKIAEYFPIPQMLEMHETKSWSAIGIVLLWFIGSLIFVYICFRRTRKDV